MGVSTADLGWFITPLRTKLNLLHSCGYPGHGQVVSNIYSLAYRLLYFMQDTRAILHAATQPKGNLFDIYSTFLSDKTSQSVLILNFSLGIVSDLSVTLALFWFLYSVKTGIRRCERALYPKRRHFTELCYVQNGLSRQNSHALRCDNWLARCVRCLAQHVISDTDVI